MTTPHDAPDPKAMAKRLRADLAARGIDIGHSETLELVAHELGHRDWNTLAATLRAQPDGHATASSAEAGFGPGIPLLRIFDQAKAYEFYTGYLGFTLDWEHRFGEHMPLYAQVSRGEALLHLTEHHGDSSPGAAVLIRITDMSALHAELTAHDYPAARPGIEDEPWGQTLTVHDPFSNRLTFHQPRSEESQPDRTTEAAAPIQMQIRMSATPEHAFEVFTSRMGEWWDPDYTPDARTFTGIDIEPLEGGEVAMRHGEGRYVWGTVTSWEPGRRYAQTFTLAHDPDFPSSVTVEFEPDPKGCFMWFSHGGWTAGNVAARARFQDWPHLLGRFADLAEA